MSQKTYIHMLDGRLRVKVPEIKHSPAKIAEVQALLRAVDGVFRVSANPETGNVLVLFDCKRVNHDRILAELRRISRFVPQAVRSAPTTRRKIAEALVHSVLQVALERMLFALV